MIVSISNSAQSTFIFICIFIVLLFLFIKSKKASENLSPEITQELKGFAILTIVFAHIGFFLVNDHQFLFPLSIMAGVGVNLFLFLSGYGLTVSKMQKEESIAGFYKKRLLRLFVPFWLVLIIFLGMDYFILGMHYSNQTIIKAFFGIFTHADIYTDINSPFWYMTFILFYYLLYPLLFFKKHPWITAGILYAITYYIVSENFSQINSVVDLYKVHLAAFPLGICGAWFSTKINIFKNVVSQSRNKKLFYKIKDIYFKFKTPLYYFGISILLFIIGYTAIHSGIGESLRAEQTISLITMGSLIFLFLIKKIEFKIFSIIGLYSYEIYLFHWPIMYRYDIFYKYIPAWLATFLYLSLFIGLGWIIKNISQKITHKI